VHNEKITQYLLLNQFRQDVLCQITNLAIIKRILTTQLLNELETNTDIRKHPPAGHNNTINQHNNELEMIILVDPGQQDLL